MVSCLETICSCHITESTERYAGAIDECYLAINEGVISKDVLTILSSNSSNMYFDILETVKDTLLKFIERIMVALNNCYMYSIADMIKHQDLIIHRFNTIKEKVKVEVYDWPSTRGFPKVIKSTVSVIDDVTNIQEKIRTDPNITLFDVEDKVDELLNSFANETIGCRIDVDNINNSVKEVVVKRVRGNATTIVMDEKTIKSYIASITDYKSEKDELVRLKKDVLHDYNFLKNTYKKVTANPTRLIDDSIGQITGPERARLHAAYRDRYTGISMAMSRLFDGYIAIYRVAFDATLEEIRNRVEMQRNIINMILMKASIPNRVTGELTRFEAEKPFSTVIKKSDIVKLTDMNFKI